MKLYKTKYRFEFGDFKKEEAGDCGLTDSFVFHSILHGEEGGSSGLVLSYDSKTDQPMSGPDLFKSWLLFTFDISERADLSPGQKQICVDAINSVRRTMGLPEKGKE